MKDMNQWKKSLLKVNINHSFKCHLWYPWTHQETKGFLVISRGSKWNILKKCVKDTETTFRSSHMRCYIKKGVLRDFTKFLGKHLCQSLFFNKVAGLRPATLLKKRLWHRCFPVIFMEFVRTHFFQRTPVSEHLLLNIHGQRALLSLVY